MAHVKLIDSINNLILNYKVRRISKNSIQMADVFEDYYYKDIRSYLGNLDFFIEIYRTF